MHCVTTGEIGLRVTTTSTVLYGPQLTELNQNSHLTQLLNICVYSFLTLLASLTSKKGVADVLKEIVGTLYVLPSSSSQELSTPSWMAIAPPTHAKLVVKSM